MRCMARCRTGAGQAYGMGRAWAWHGHEMGMAWAWHGHGMGMAWAWHGHGTGVWRVVPAGSRICSLPESTSQQLHPGAPSRHSVAYLVRGRVRGRVGVGVGAGAGVGVKVGGGWGKWSGEGLGLGLGEGSRLGPGTGSGSCPGHRVAYRGSRRRSHAPNSCRRICPSRLCSSFDLARTRSASASVSCADSRAGSKAVASAAPGWG